MRYEVGWIIGLAAAFGDTPGLGRVDRAGELAQPRYQLKGKVRCPTGRGYSAAQ